MPKYLMDEYPVMVYPSLAVAVGLTEATVLQKLHGWLAHYEENPQRSQAHVHDGRFWVYGTAEYWADQLPFLSSSTIRRALADLRDLGIVLTGNYNKRGYDRTLWYSIDYEAYAEFIDLAIDSKEADPSGQNGQMTSAQNEQMDLPKMGTPIPILSSNSSSTLSPKDGASAPQPSQPTLGGVVDPEQSTDFSNDLDKILQNLLRDEARADGRRGPRKFETMAQKTTWRTAAQTVIDLGGTEELQKALLWALKNGRKSRSRVVATVEAWAQNLKTPTTRQGKGDTGTVMTQAEYEEWAMQNMPPEDDTPAAPTY